MNDKPWELNSDLIESRIIELTEFLAQVRGEVTDRHEPSLGDSRLSLGIRAYECCRNRIITESKNNTWSWLSIVTYDGKFTFKIGETPVRFMRNDPDNIPLHKLIYSEEAQKQTKMFFLEDSIFINGQVRWFIILDTDYDSPADSAYFVGSTEGGDVVCKWNIPLSDYVTTLTTVGENVPEPVYQEPAKISVKKFKKEDDMVDSNE